MRILAAPRKPTVPTDSRQHQLTRCNSKIVTDLRSDESPGPHKTQLQRVNKSVLKTTASPAICAVAALTENRFLFTLQETKIFAGVRYRLWAAFPPPTWKLLTSLLMLHVLLPFTFHKKNVTNMKIVQANK